MTQSPAETTPTQTTITAEDRRNAMSGGYSLCYNEWALDDNIRTELGLLMILSSLSAKTGYCYASNAYLASLFDKDPTAISRKIKKLISRGYVVASYEREGKVVTKRTITIPKSKHLTKKCEPLDNGVNGQVDKSVKENSTSNNNTINITKKKYGELGLVRLTDEEYETLNNQYKAVGKSFRRAIELLDGYIGSSGKKYTSHRAVMKRGNWVWDKVDGQGSVVAKSATKFAL